MQQRHKKFPEKRYCKIENENLRPDLVRNQDFAKEEDLNQKKTTVKKFSKIV